MTTISDGTTTLTPLEVLGYTSRRAGSNILHPIIGRDDVEATMRPAGLRAGTLTMLISTLAEALALEALHAQPLTFTLTDPDLPGLDMTYITAGDIVVELDDETRARWTVSVDFHEVAP